METFHIHGSFFVGMNFVYQSLKYKMFLNQDLVSMLGLDLMIEQMSLIPGDNYTACTPTPGPDQVHTKDKIFTIYTTYKALIS